MTRTITKSVAKLERLMTLLDAYNRLDLSDDGTVAHANRCIRAQNELLDHCVECGMATDGDEFEFAARVTTLFLLAA